ncbi:MAG: aminotransferase class I/II-fold pyridoxal phosphate-dependent enzyme, partial [Pseudomonadota bacterium]
MKNGRFTHGGDVFGAARDLGLSWRKVLDYSANVNPLGPPPGLKKRLMDSFGLVEHYPDPFAWGWRKELADHYGLSPQEIMAGNGTTSLMYLLARTLRPKRPVIVAPAFAEYEVSLSQVGARVRRVECRSRDEFDLTPKTLEPAFASGPDLVFLANPSSPAGRLVEPELLDRSLYLSRKAGAVLAVDEAFLDFTDADRLLPAVRKHNHLIVLRSLTKFYA